MTRFSDRPSRGVPRPARPHTTIGRPVCGRVAVVVARLVRRRCQEILEGLATALNDADLELRITTVDEDATMPGIAARSPALPTLDAAVVVVGSLPEPARERLRALAIPVVSAGDLGAPSPSVSLDDEGAIEEAVRHLLDLGHRRIAMLSEITTESDHSSWAHRTFAYVSALHDAGIAYDPGLVACLESPSPDCGAVMDRFLEAASSPTALVADSDELAVRALSALRRADVPVPAEFSVVGVGDHPLAEVADLTTVRQEPWQQGFLAGHMVAAILRGERVSDAIVPTRVVPRRSTGSAPT